MTVWQNSKLCITHQPAHGFAPPVSVITFFPERTAKIIWEPFHVWSMRRKHKEEARLYLLCNIHLYKLMAWKHHFKGKGVFEKRFLLKSWYDNVLSMDCIHWATFINHWISTKIIAHLQDDGSSSLSVLYWFPDNLNRVAIIFTDVLHMNLHRQQYAGSGTIAFLFWLHAFIVIRKWVQSG